MCVHFMNIILQAGWNKRITLNQRTVRVGEKSYSFNASEVFCDDECFDYEVGVVEVSLTDVSKAAQRRLDAYLGNTIYILCLVFYKKKFPFRLNCVCLLYSFAKLLHKLFSKITLS